MEEDWVKIPSTETLTNQNISIWHKFYIATPQDWYQCVLSTRYVWQATRVTTLINGGFDYPMTCVKISGERGCWELCDFPTPNDPHSHGSWDKSKPISFEKMWPCGCWPLIAALLGIMQFLNGYGLSLYSITIVIKIVMKNGLSWMTHSATGSRHQPRMFNKQYSLM